MAQCTWTQVVDDPAARHLVAVRLQPKAADEPAVLMAALIEELAPAGDYALLTRCEEEGAVLLCAFSHPADALGLATAIGAEDTDAYSEWASHHCFNLDRSTAQAIADAIEASVTKSPMVQRVRMPDVVPAHA